MKLTEADSNLIIRLSKSEPMKRNARSITKATEKSYNYVTLRLQRLVDLGIIIKIKRGRTVFYSSPTPDFCAQAQEVLR